MVLLPVQAELSVNILGSSIAMLTGQKPPFRLLVRAIRSDSGARALHVHHAVSDAFVVATQRVKGAQKAEIPHIEEHVSKIENVGVQTQNKLLDIRTAAAAAGITGLNVVHNSVNTGLSHECITAARIACLSRNTEPRTSCLELICSG